jgi:hypothetical protein
MYDAAQIHPVDIEDVDAITARVKDILDEHAYRDAILSGRYHAALQEGNDYAYKTSGVWAVPSYRMGGEKLDSVENIGVTKAQLRAFLTSGR